MEKKIRQLLRYLQIEYVAVWVLPLLLVALYETGVMTEGAYAGRRRKQVMKIRLREDKRLRSSIQII